MAERRSTADLLRTDFVREPTRRALLERMQTPHKTVPEYFSPAAFRQLQAIAGRIILQDTHEVDLAGVLDTQLAGGTGKGWRYDTLPPDQTLFESGILATDAEAQHRHGLAFDQLSPDAQDTLLEILQRNAGTDDIWKGLHAGMFFTELLAQLVTIYYSHPAGRDQCGDRSFADAHGWTALGLNSGSDIPD
jgi:hypothetical protein